MVELEKVKSDLLAGDYQTVVSYLYNWAELIHTSGLSIEDVRKIEELLEFAFFHRARFAPFIQELFEVLNFTFLKMDTFFTKKRYFSDTPSQMLMDYVFSTPKIARRLMTWNLIQNALIQIMENSSSKYFIKMMTNVEFINLICQFIHPNTLASLDGEPILSRAIKWATDEAFECLIANGADVNGSHRPMAKQLLKKRAYIPILFQGENLTKYFCEATTEFYSTSQRVPSRVREKDISESSSQIVIQNKDVEDFSPLQLAIREGNLSKLLILLNHPDIDINIQSLSYGEKDTNGDFYRNVTPLMSAAYLGRLEMVRALILKGAQLDKPDVCQETALFYAIRAHNLEILDLLIHAGCDVELLNDKNQSVMDLTRLFAYHDMYQSFDRVQMFRNVITKAPHLLGSFFHRTKHYEVVSVPGDGHCLFHAIALHVPHTHEQLRMMTADFIEAHPEIYAPSVTTDFATYVQRLRLGAWGDHIEIDALSRILQRRIVVNFTHQLLEPRVFGEEYGQPSSIDILYNQINHYDGLLQKPCSQKVLDLMNLIITLPMELRDKIGSHFTLETIKNLFGSFNLMYRFFKEHSDSDAHNPKPSV